MKKLITSILSLAVFCSIAAFGVGIYVNKLAHDTLDNNITMLKENGFELSSYDSLKVDFLKQKIVLSGLKIEGENNPNFKLKFDKIEFLNINPFSFSNVSIGQVNLSKLQITQNRNDYSANEVTLDALKLAYQPHFEAILAAKNSRQMIALFHKEVNYKQLSFNQFSLRDAQGAYSQVEGGIYKKGQLLNNLPNDIELHLVGMNLNRNHLPPAYAETLSNYNIDQLNGILDLSLNYDTEEGMARIAIDNLNIGGLANLKFSANVAMTDERFEKLYNFDNFDRNINQLPIKSANLLYDDLGLYNYFIGQQAPKLNMDDKSLKSNVYYGLLLGSGQIIDIDKRAKLTSPLFDFIAKPASLKIELTPTRPVRFEHYLNVFDANVLIKDFNPTIEYLN